MNPNLTIDIAETESQMISLRDPWKIMCVDPETDFDFILTMCQTREQILSPFILFAKRGGEVISILVGRLERIRPNIPLGYAKLPLPSARCLILSGQTPMGEDSPETASAFMGTIRKYLRQGKIDLLWVHRASEHTALFGELGNCALIRRDYFPATNLHWQSKVNGTYDQFMATRSANYRYNVKRYSKRFLKEPNFSPSIRHFTGIDEIEKLLHDTEQIARTTYHRGLGAGFAFDVETKRRIELYAKQDGFHAAILYADQTPIAFWHGFVYKKSFHIWTTGYDPQYRDLRPGQFLLHEIIKKVCQTPNIERLDFGSGDAQYKRELADCVSTEVSMFIYGYTFRALTINLIRTPAMAMIAIIRLIMANTKLQDRLKRLWRSRLSRVDTQR